MNVEPKDWFILALSTIIGIVLGAYFLRAGRPKGKVLAFFVDGQNVIDRQRPDTVTDSVEFFFDGKSIPRLSVCQITIWNDGDQHINMNDVARLDPLRLRLRSEGNFLELRVDASDPACEVTAAIDVDDPRSARVMFRFMNYTHKFTLRVLHTAVIPRVEVVGQIMGGVVSDVREKERKKVPLVLTASLFVPVMVVYIGYVIVTRLFPELLEDGTRILVIGIPMALVFSAVVMNRVLLNSSINRLRLRIEGLTPPDEHA